MKNRIKKIKVLAMDVDGVLTDGKIIYDKEGQAIKIFDVKDGYGLILLHEAGLKTALISAKAAKPVTRRAKDMKITKVYQNAYPKMHAYKRMLKDLKVKDSQVCFVGDDLPDIPILKRAGFSIAVKNAVSEVKKEADYVTKKCSGNGAVREIVELILQTQGKWKKVLPK